MPLPRVLLCCCLLVLATVPGLFGQAPSQTSNQASNLAPAPTTTPAATALEDALSGSWTGYLEYRDYSEPATSTKRVQLPTWLTVTPTSAGLAFRYIYDDGPGKILDERNTVILDPAKATWTEVEAGHPNQVWHIAGLESLKSGHGTLTLTSTGTDDDKPAELRITLTVRRNLIEFLQEVRPVPTQPDSQAPFAFRHLYRFIRSAAPAATATR